MWRIRARRVFLAVLGRFVVMTLLAGVLVAIPAVFEVRETQVQSAADQVVPLADIDLKLTLAARVPRPTAMAVRYGDDAIYIASKKGYVWELRDGQRRIVLDIHRGISVGFEQGLLGLAFTPDGTRMIINFTNKQDASITRVYNFDAGGVDESSKKDLWVVPKPTSEHNAGNVAFGPDGYLYVSLGDGGLSGDPDRNAQSLDTMLGKILRVDVLPDGRYAIPPDNPFVDRKGARPEIWDYGFRNPWRFSFDRVTGDLWISDVGRDNREEVNFERGDSRGGHNYGWNRMEGSVPYKDAKPKKSDVLPVYDYAHDELRTVCAAVGGYVYRGSNIPELDGTYFFSDFCRGGLDAIRVKPLPGAPSGYDVDEYRRYADIDVDRVSAFGQDAAGELYVLALDDGAVYRIDPA